MPSPETVNRKVSAHVLRPGRACVSYRHNYIAFDDVHGRVRRVGCLVPTTVIKKA